MQKLYENEVLERRWDELASNFGRRLREQVNEEAARCGVSPEQLQAQFDKLEFRITEVNTEKGTITLSAPRNDQ